MIDILHIPNTCKTAYQAEITGQYESGLKELQWFWDYTDPDAVPNKIDLDDRDVAELLLRTGALYGLHGISTKDRPQEYSKNLLTQALTCFQELGDELKEAECANYLALAYYRLGNSEECDVWLSYGLDRTLFDTVYLHTLIIESMILLADFKYDFVLNKFSKWEPYFEDTDNLFLKGVFYTNFALSKKHFGFFNEAIQNFMIAESLFIELDNKHYQSLVQNNLAWTYLRDGKTEKAMEFSGKGLQTAQANNDLRQAGAIYDTQAQISLNNKNYIKGLCFADKAIKTLEKTEAHGYLIEAYETKIKCFFNLGSFTEALLCYHHAMNIAVEKTGQKVIDRLTATIANCFAENQIIEICRESANLSFSEFYELVFPENIKVKNQVFAVEAATNRLLMFGITPGDLIIAEKTEVMEGDLIALKTLASNGFAGFLKFDKKHFVLDFKDGGDGIRIPMSNVQFAGKVVGCCRISYLGQEKLIIEPIINDFDL